MRVGITGHRPERISEPEPIKDLISEAIQHFGATRFYQGMAAGVDLWSAKEAWKLKISYVCVKPWAGHKPRIADQIEYEKVVKHSLHVVNVTDYEEYPGAWVYQKRNEWIVDEVDAMIAVWDGKPYGGTFNCVRYAVENDRLVMRIDPDRKVLRFVGLDEVV
jgi:uncharacterized phage-like protein YoqJ